MSSFVSGLRVGRALCGLAAVLVAAPSRGEVMRSNLDAPPIGLLAASGISLDAAPPAAPFSPATGCTAAGTADASSASAEVLGDIAMQVRIAVLEHAGAEPVARSQPTSASVLDVMGLRASPFSAPAAALSPHLVVFIPPEVGGASGWIAGWTGILTPRPGLHRARAAARSTQETTKDKGRESSPAAVNITAAPEPSALALAGIGMATIAGVRFGRRPRRQLRLRG